MSETTVGRSSGTTGPVALGREDALTVYFRGYFSPERCNRGHNSFNRFRDLLTSPPCGWPTTIITTVANELNPDLATEMLVTQFAAASARTRAPE